VSRPAIVAASSTGSTGDRSGRAALLFVILAVTVALTPMFFAGDVSGHDFKFHLASWMDVAGQWHEGILYPRWAQWANGGFGEPRFIFYPPASWMLGAGLGSVLGWALAARAYVWLLLIVAGISMRKLAREWLPGRQAAMAAVFFAVNPYHLVIVYYRSDFAELLAGALLPLMLWGAVEVCRQGWCRVPLLAAIFAAIWLSNAPAGVIATYSLVLALVVGCILRQSLRPLLLGGTAIIAGFGLAAFYIVPAAWEQRWVQISEATVANLAPDRNLIFTHASDPEFLLFNWKVSGVALLVMLLTGIAIVFAARRRREFSEVFWIFLVLGAASAFLLFRPSLLLWHYLPKLRFVQFTWRWLEPLSVVFAFFTAASIGLYSKFWARCLVFAILMAIAITGALIAYDTWWDGGDVSYLVEMIDSGHGYEGTDEYTPSGSDRYQLPGAPIDSDEVSLTPPTAPISLIDSGSGKAVSASGMRLQFDHWTAEHKSFSAEIPVPVILAVRLLNYPAWEVRMDGHLFTASTAPNTEQMLLALPAGTHHIDIRFRRTADRAVGDAISALVGITLSGFAWILRRRRAPAA
jgi:hypothetical protein